MHFEKDRCDTEILAHNSPDRCRLKCRSLNLIYCGPNSNVQNAWLTISRVATGLPYVPVHWFLNVRWIWSCQCFMYCNFCSSHLFAGNLYNANSFHREHIFYCCLRFYLFHRFFAGIAAHTCMAIKVTFSMFFCFTV